MNNLYIVVLIAYFLNLYANYYMSERKHLSSKTVNKYSLIFSMGTILILYISAFNGVFLK